MADDVIARHAGQGPTPWIAEPLRLHAVRLSYDAEFDSLGLMFGARRAGSTLRRSNGVSWRIDATSGEIYGIEIEAFERNFLPTFTQDAALRQRVESHWQDLKANNLGDDASRIHFAQHILSAIDLADGHAALAGNSPQQ